MTALTPIITSCSTTEQVLKYSSNLIEAMIEFLKATDETLIAAIKATGMADNVLDILATFGIRNEAHDKLASGNSIVKAFRVTNLDTGEIKFLNETSHYAELEPRTQKDFFIPSSSLPNESGTYLITVKTKVNQKDEKFEKQKFA